MNSVRLIRNTYNYSEIRHTVIELHRNVIIFTKHFLW